MSEFFTQWIDKPVVWKTIAAVLTVVIINLILGFIRRTISQYIKDSTSLYKVKKLVTFIAYVVIILIVAGIFSDKLQSVTVALGIAGAGIAFALQEVIISFAGWIALTFGHFYKIGNRVQIAGITGDVIDIGVLRTTLMECGQWVNGDLYNGRIVRVSNSFVFKEPVFNYSADFPFLWDEIMLPVTYGSDYKMTKEILNRVAHEVVGDCANFANEKWKEIVKKYMIENAKVDPLVTATANDNWVEFTLRYVVDYKMRRSTKDRLFLRVLEEINKTDEKVQIASTSSNLNLTRVPQLDINLKGKMYEKD